MFTGKRVWRFKPNGNATIDNAAICIEELEIECRTQRQVSTGQSNCYHGHLWPADTDDAHTGAPGTGGNRRNSIAPVSHVSSGCTTLARLRLSSYWIFLPARAG